MLYIFNILPGRMITFDLEISLGSVLELKKLIQAKFNIPVNKQILLINGGELLDNEFRVCNYNGIGTDSTPIYLFNLYALENPLPQTTNQLPTSQSSPNQLQFLSSSPSSNHQFPSAIISNAPSQQFILSLHSQQIQDEQQIKMMKSNVADALNLEASYSTIVTRTEIAKQIRELTTQQLMSCEQLIRDQHLQFQGFGAAIANLEDLETLFDQNVEKTIQIYQQFLNNKSQYNELLDKLNIDIQLLDMIPVLDVFNEKTENEEFDKEKMERIEHERSLDEPDAAMIGSTLNSNTLKDDTLLDWIHSKDDRFTLNNLINNCLIAMDHFNEQCFEDLTQRIQEVKSNLNNEDNKKINKIEDRFYRLDELLVKAKKIVHDTNGLTSNFIQNQNSASNVRDNSIYVDLCTSHQTQLKIILQNLIDLNNIKNRYLKAKHELIYSLHSKLKNIILLESDLSSTNSALIICSENLRKLVKNLQVLQQVHRTPKVYFFSINEILRRNIFKKRFGTWSNALNSKCIEIYEKETALRNEFQDKVSNHFLTMLFSGLNDDFPQFFIKQLPKFDSQLVEISENDLNRLKQVLPKLKEFCEQLENKDYIEYIDELKINEDLLNESLIFENLCLNCFKNSQLTDEDECKLSRETEKSESTDFVKILHELDLINTDDLITDNKVLKKQESCQSTELASEAVESLIIENESVVDLFKKDLDTDKKQANIDLLKKGIENKLKERETELRKQYDEEMEKMKNELAEQLKQEMSKLEARLKMEHKLEIDSIRSRFKLACASINMESSQMKKMLN